MWRLDIHEFAYSFSRSNDVGKKKFWSILAIGTALVASVLSIPPLQFFDQKYNAMIQTLVFFAVLGVAVMAYVDELYSPREDSCVARNYSFRWLSVV